MSVNQKREKPSPEISACKGIMKKLFANKYKHLAWIFYEPIEAQVLGLYDYHDIIKEPMDLTTVKYRLNSGFYCNAIDFAKDVRLIFFNTYLYTNPGHVCYEMAVKLQKIFEELYAKVPMHGECGQDSCELSDSSSESEAFNCDLASPTMSNQSSFALIDESPPGALKRTHKQSLEETSDSCEEEPPLTVAENLDLHAKVQQLDGEILLNVIHMIHQLEGLNAKYANKEFEFDVGTLKTHTKRTILSYMASKGITGKRIRRKKENF